MRSSAAILAAIFTLSLGAWPSAFGAPDRIRVLVFTGGHGFQRAAFFKLFEGYPDIGYEEAVYPKAAESFAPERAKAFDVFVFYDMFQGLDAKGRERLARLIREGKPAVFLHHALGSHQDWPEYERIVGGRYRTAPLPKKGIPASKFFHDQDVRIHIADPDHPITRGLSDYTIHDETYQLYRVDPKVQVLLETDHPRSEKAVAWVHTYGQGRVAYIQGGHDGKAYGNPAYRRLIVQAVRWAAKRPPEGGPYRPLFNGRDLEGWKPEGGAVWEVEDGVLVGRQGPKYAPGDLFTAEEFGDFELEVEFRVVWPANSGVWFRYRSPQEAYQADILEWKNPVCWTGSLYCPGKMFLSMNEDPTLLDREGWNGFRIRAQGDHIVIYLNERKVADVRDGSFARGRIGFQVHPGEAFGPMRIHVRRIAIRAE